MGNDLSRSAVIDLLSAAMFYDNRNVSDAQIYAWRESARRGRWSFEDALEAIHAHYAESTAYLMPAHVTERASGLSARRWCGFGSTTSFTAAKRCASSAPMRLPQWLV